MDSTQSEDVLEMESPVNNSSERCFQTNQIWHELFPEPKTMLMSELEDLIDKIGEVSILESLYLAAKHKDSRILKVDCFHSFFGRNWKHQKDVSKLTGL